MHIYTIKPHLQRIYGHIFSYSSVVVFPNSKPQSEMVYELMAFVIHFSLLQPQRHVDVRMEVPVLLYHVREECLIPVDALLAMEEDAVR